MAISTMEDMMKNFHADLGPERLKRLMEQFNGTKAVCEMFTSLWDCEEAHKYLDPTLMPSEKNEEKSKSLQEKGDDFFELQCFSEALEQYTLSIMHAPHPKVLLDDCCREILGGTQELLENEHYNILSSGYAKRSAALFELGHYEQCLNDIKRALHHGYVDDAEMLEKRKRACVSIQNDDEIRETGDLLDPKKYMFGLTVPRKTLTKMPAVDEKHPLFPSLSNSLKVVYTPDKGRHIIADRDIYPGEILGVEKSSCSVLDEANLSSHCSTCIVKCLAPIPCPDCAMVVFCCRTCRDNGLSGDHWLECQLLSTMIAIGLQPVFALCFKVFQHNSCEELKAFTESSMDENGDLSYGIRDLSESTTSNFKTMQAIEHIVTNKDLRPSGDLYVKCMISFVITKLLQQCGRMFPKRKEEGMTPSREDLLFIGQIIFTNQLKISCNGFKIVEIQCTGPFSQMTKNTKGSALFPILCLFNHSCYPNSEPYCYGRTQVLRASRPIPAGAEVTEGYIRGFYLQPRETRQKILLSVYQFNCVCTACEADWPTYQELPSTLQFKCLDCPNALSNDARVCTSCSLDYKRKDHPPDKQLLVDEWVSNVNLVQAAFLKSQQIASKMMWGKEASDEDLNIISQAITLLEKHVPFPCHPLWDAHDALDLYFHQERKYIDCSIK